jgi:hypothetical protein
METRELSKKGLYVGTGMGLILFVLVGLLPGSVVGGVIGLKVAAALFGEPAGISVLPRVIVAAGMIFGVLSSAVTFIFGMGILGWISGFVIDAIKGSAPEEVQPAGASNK